MNTRRKNDFVQPMQVRRKSAGDAGATRFTFRIPQDIFPPIPTVREGRLMANLSPNFVS